VIETPDKLGIPERIGGGVEEEEEEGEPVSLLDRVRIPGFNEFWQCASSERWKVSVTYDGETHTIEFPSHVSVDRLKEFLSLAFDGDSNAQITWVVFFDYEPRPVLDLAKYGSAPRNVWLHSFSNIAEGMLVDCCHVVFEVKLHGNNVRLHHAVFPEDATVAHLKQYAVSIRCIANDRQIRVLKMDEMGICGMLQDEQRLDSAHAKLRIEEVPDEQRGLTPENCFIVVYLPAKYSDIQQIKPDETFGQMKVRVKAMLSSVNPQWKDRLTRAQFDLEPIGIGNTGDISEDDPATRIDSTKCRLVVRGDRERPHEKLYIRLTP
jgi:hypothetical protein